MFRKKEKLPNALTSEKDLFPPSLIKDPAHEKRGRDAIDIESQKFFDQISENISEWKKADVTLQILLRNKIINPNEEISSVREKMGEREEELEETLQALKSGGKSTRNTKMEYDDIDEEFGRMAAEEKDKIETELEYLQTTYRVLGFMLRDELINESDVLKKATEEIFSRIRENTP